MICHNIPNCPAVMNISVEKAFFSPVNYFLKMNPQEVAGLKQMKIFMEFLTFIAKLLSKGALSVYKDKSVHFFQGLFLKLLKRNKILYGAGGPENV